MRIKFYKYSAFVFKYNSDDTVAVKGFFFLGLGSLKTFKHTFDLNQITAKQIDLFVESLVTDWVKKYKF